jgi:hypothetical protein
MSTCYIKIELLKVGLLKASPPVHCGVGCVNTEKIPNISRNMAASFVRQVVQEKSL